MHEKRTVLFCVGWPFTVEHFRDHKRIRQQCSCISATKAFLMQVLKWYIKEGRQLGVHVSPTLSVNGLMVDSSSSWQLKDYQELLDPLLEQ